MPRRCPEPRGIEGRTKFLRRIAVIACRLNLLEPYSSQRFERARYIFLEQGPQRVELHPHRERYIMSAFDIIKVVRKFGFVTATRNYAKPTGGDERLCRSFQKESAIHVVGVAKE